jgi:two-component system response regulator FixJ
MSGPHIVYVIDDDPAQLASLDFLLQTIGIACRPYRIAGAFLRDVETLKPGCVLTDFNMPGLSGLDLQAALLERRNDWPVIFMAGIGKVPVIVLAIKRGAVEFIEKPFCEERLLAALHAGFVKLRNSSTLAHRPEQV